MALLHLATELQPADLELESVVLLPVTVPRLYLHQVMGLLLVHLVVALLPLTTQLQAADSEVGLVVLLPVTLPRPHLHQVMGLPQRVLELREFLLQATQLLAVDSVVVLLHRVTVHQPLLHLVMELQIVEEEAVVELLLLITLLLRFLLTMFLLPLHQVTGLHQHRLPAMGHQQHLQTDLRRRPEGIVPPNRRLLRLQVTEPPQYLHQATDLLAFPLHPSVPERTQV